jgi:hypothetical protein
MIGNAIAITLVNCHDLTPIVGFPPFTIPHPCRDVKDGMDGNMLGNVQLWKESGSRDNDSLDANLLVRPDSA